MFFEISFLDSKNISTSVWANLENFKTQHESVRNHL